MGQSFTVHFVDRDVRLRAEAAREILALGHHAEVYAELAELQEHPPRDGILLVHLDPGGDVPAVLTELSRMRVELPLVVASESSAIERVVEAVRAGALDYLPLPFERAQLRAMIERARGRASLEAEARRRMIEACARVDRLTDREREVLEHLINGSSNKLIARDLAISPRTVEIHRANMMQKLDAKHIAEAVRLYFEARLSRAA